jgi:RNA polymerase sigma-70 factor (ECF subfamily)
MTPAVPDEEQDREDMRHLKEGHEPALNSLMGRHAERLFHYLLRQVQNDSDATDLAQETFVRVFQARERFNPEQKFTTWMYAIATNLVRDRFRWQKRHPQISLHAETDDGGAMVDRLVDKSAAPDEQMAAEERAGQVREAVASLPEDLRNALILSEYEQLSHAEVGAVLNCTAKAVETRLYRARIQLRERLGKLLSHS